MGRLIRLRSRSAGQSAPPSGVTSIPLSITRMVSGSGNTFVSNGVPLRPGDLSPSQLANVRLFTNTGPQGQGVEQAIYVEALEGRHSDGTVISLLVQFSAGTMTYGSPITGELRLGEARQTSDIAKTAISSIPAFAYPLTETQKDDLQVVGIPDGVAFPSSVAHLLATNLTDPTVSAASVNALGGYYAAFETTFSFYADMYWDIWGTFADPMPDGFPFADNVIGATGYYERGVFHTEQLMATADVATWFPRSCAYAFALRTAYYQPNDYAIVSNVHYVNVEMMALHYWLTGDPESRVAVKGLANALYTSYVDGTGGLYADLRGYDTRITARVFEGCMSTYRLGWADIDWLARTNNCLERILGNGPAQPLLRSTGPVAGAWAPEFCGGTETNIAYGFMNGLMMRALRHYYERISADARIQTAIQNCCDYLIASTLIPESGAQSTCFSYLNAYCPGEQDAPTNPAVDLNTFFVSNLAWLAKQLGVSGAGAPYLALAEQFFETIRRAPHDGTTGPLFNDVISNAYHKQFAEAFHDALPFLYYRLG
jgi:hypothetical protein